ncbi:MAG: hypothetical protein K2W82_13695 [Candidatus Obscuribacterales bacterium]|nr:hypothetical protein [Candidatus Obscuribacterales bacterium]
MAFEGEGIKRAGGPAGEGEGKDSGDSKAGSPTASSSPIFEATDLARNKVPASDNQTMPAQFGQPIEITDTPLTEFQIKAKDLQVLSKNLQQLTADLANEPVYADEKPLPGGRDQIDPKLDAENKRQNKEEYAKKLNEIIKDPLFGNTNPDAFFAEGIQNGYLTQAQVADFKRYITESKELPYVGLKKAQPLSEQTRKQLQRMVEAKPITVEQLRKIFRDKTK